MNKKAQMAGVGALIMMFVAIIVGVVLLQSSAQNIGSSINTVAVVNESLGVASNSTTVYLTSYKSISDVVVINNSNGAIVPATNYTVTNNVVYNGQEAVSILPKATTAYAGYQWNISGTAQPLGYVPESGSRTIVGLIVLFGALAIAIIVLGPSLKEITGVGM
jgi:hypothetical protein